MMSSVVDLAQFRDHKNKDKLATSTSVTEDLLAALIVLLLIIGALGAIYLAWVLVSGASSILFEAASVSGDSQTMRN